ncbi:MAG: GWxTD domain-containing protein [Bacteroidales bacterium]|nr:GWxTD domain-containing protein [Bacteroidales bacterium]
MKKLMLLCMVALASFAMKAQTGKTLNSYISYSTFNVPGDKATPYVETYITFETKSLTYIKNTDGKFNATVDVTVLFKQGESIKNYGKYTLNSPAVDDTATMGGYFMDMQRYQLPNGTYSIELTLEDKNDMTGRPFKVTSDITVDFPERLCFSSIIGLESYSKAATESECTKNGYDLIPIMIPYYPEAVGKLTYYCEIYNTRKQLGANEKYLLNTYISTFENGTKLTNFFASKRMNAKDTEVILGSMDISSLPTGNYYLVLEARDRNNEIIGFNRFFFQRSNQNYHVDNAVLASINVEHVFSGNITSIDSIRKYIKSCYAISTEVERTYAEELLKTDDLRTMQQFFYTFWSSRNSLEPEKEWKTYYSQVLRCDASFSGLNLPGCLSDRGVVFLKYGTPDRIVQSYNEPGAFPYEIWHYYTLGSQRNKKFVFMASDIVTNNFILIHSNAVGELNNPRWTNEIYHRTYDTYYDYNVDQHVEPDSYGDKALDYYNNPR